MFPSYSPTQSHLAPAETPNHFLPRCLPQALLPFRTRHTHPHTPLRSYQPRPKGRGGFTKFSQPLPPPIPRPPSPPPQPPAPPGPRRAAAGALAPPGGEPRHNRPPSPPSPLPSPLALLPLRGAFQEHLLGEKRPKVKGSP